MSLSRVRIVITGAVQGVGFRPFVYRLARELGITGWVSNSAQGLRIEAEGSKTNLDEMLVRLNRDRPRHASIHSLEFSFLDPAGFSAFEIRESDGDGARTAFVSPDIATCPNCLAEILDPANRRYRYPFTNCTNCGPRFTIIDALPYDRINTTMRTFTMCDACRREYEDPLDRRFHAQPNACPDCGPRLEFLNDQGRSLANSNAALTRAVGLIAAGYIVAVKGIGGFHLVVDAVNEAAVARLRQRKHREEKPFALISSLDEARDLCVIEPLEERVLTSPEAPIVLLKRHLHADTKKIAPSVAPGNPQLGVMLPYTPLHHLLLSELGRPLVATSGNRSDEPICTDESSVVERLGGIADGFLVHNRPIRRHADDSIVRVLLGREQILRRARGYAPLPIVLKHSTMASLAAGSHLKNTIALAVPGSEAYETNVFISQHIGDLENEEALLAFNNVIRDFEQLYECRPEKVIADMHPDYFSSQYAPRPTLRIQHHCAHVASCMAENELAGPAVGVAWDGSGFGTDGTVWGGEFFVAEEGMSFRRAAHLRTFPLPGGDAAARRPQHAALGLLYEILGESAFGSADPPALRQMLQKGFRSPRTSSAGRLFDAVASIAGLRQQITFEGQAAMELEFMVDTTIEDHYAFDITPGDPMVVDWGPMVLQLKDELQAGAPIGVIAARFHNTLAEMILGVTHRIGITRVVLTGGCFQNRYLTERAVHRLTAENFKVYRHQRVPPNDGGIAFGQIAAAFATENVCVSQYQAR